MSEQTNEQFPPISPNGKTHTPKNGSAKTRPPGQQTKTAEHPTSTNGAEGYNRRSTTERPTTPKTEQDATLKPTQLLSVKVSAYVAKYPWQTIGGLMGVLLVIILFKTFYQGKNWKAERMAEEAYYMANQYARNNSTNLHPYLSQAFRREVRQMPGLLPLSMQAATRGGSITGAEAVNLREITPDSVLVELAVRFENGREEKRYQPLVYEKDQWRLGLTYSR